MNQKRDRTASASLAERLTEIEVAKEHDLERLPRFVPPSEDAGSENLVFFGAYRPAPIRLQVPTQRAALDNLSEVLEATTKMTQSLIQHADKLCAEPRCCESCCGAQIQPLRFLRPEQDGCSYAGTRDLPESSSTYWEGKPEALTEPTYNGNDAHINDIFKQRPMKRIDLSPREPDPSKKTFAFEKESLINRAYPDHPDTDAVFPVGKAELELRAQYRRSGYRWRLNHPGCKAAEPRGSNGTDSYAAKWLSGPGMRRCYQEAYILWLREPVGGRRVIYFEYPPAGSLDSIPDPDPGAPSFVCDEGSIRRRTVLPAVLPGEVERTLPSEEFAHGGEEFELGGQFVINFLVNQEANKHYEDRNGLPIPDSPLRIPYDYGYPGQIADYIRNLCRIWVWRSEFDAFYCFEYQGEARLTYWAQWWAEAEAWWDEAGVLVDSSINGGISAQGTGDSVSTPLRRQLEGAWEDVSRMPFPPHPEIPRRKR